MWSTNDFVYSDCYQFAEGIGPERCPGGPDNRSFPSCPGCETLNSTPALCDAPKAMTPQDHRVVVLGASPKPARHANQAIRTLKEMGYQVVPVHPRYREIEGLAVTPSLGTVAGPVHTLTLYVGPQRSAALMDAIAELGPGRVILNPGTESLELERRLAQAGIPAIHGCTLVMLRTGTF